jgi:MFS family permease
MAPPTNTPGNPGHEGKVSHIPVVLLETANFFSGVANAIVLITIPWLVLEQTDSPLAAGVVAAVSSVLGVFVSPAVGFLIDKLGRRFISVASDIFSAVSVALIPLLAMLTDLTFAWILALASLGAIFDPAGYTARKTLIPDAAAVGRTDIAKLNGIHEGIFAVGWTLGPVLAAVLISTLGAISSFWIAFAFFIIAAVCVLAMRVSDAGQIARDEKLARGEVEHFWTEAFRGITLLWRDKPLRVLTIAVMILAAVYLPTESIVLPVYFEAQNFPEGLGIVITALAGGTMVGAFGYGWLTKRMSGNAMVRVVLIGTMISIVPLAFLLPLPIMVISGFILGLSWGPMQPLLNSVVQRRVPADAQGRVFGAQMALFYAGPPIAMLIVGAAVEGYGVEISYLAIAAVLVLSSLVILFLPSIRRIDD